MMYRHRMEPVALNSIEDFVLTQTATGDVADFTALEGYATQSKPSLRGEFLRRLLLGRIDGAKILRPGVRIIGVRIEGMLNLRDCAGDGLPALCLEGCDFEDLIDLSGSRVARLSLIDSRIRALIARGLRSDGDVVFQGVQPMPAPDPIAFVDLRSSQIGGSIIGAAAQLKALTQDQNGEGRFTAFALDLSFATVSSGVVLDCGFNADGGAALISAEIAGLFEGSNGTFQSATPGGYAIAAGMARIGGAARLDHASTSGVVDFAGARIGGNLQCTGGVFSNSGGDALRCLRAHVGGAVELGGLSAVGLVQFDYADIDGSFACWSARFANHGLTALSAAGARIGRGVYFAQMKVDGEVSLMDARIGSGLSIWGASLAHAPRYALNLQTARIEGELQAFDNVFEGAVTFSGARVGRLYDVPDTAWAGASAIDLNEFHYADLSTKPWFFFADRASAQQTVGAAPSKSAKRDIWRMRADWLKRNTGQVGNEACPFSHQPWKHCAATLARSGHYSDARRLAREEQREANRQRPFWMRPFVWAFAEQTFGYGLSVTRATMTAMLFWVVGWVGADLMVQRGVLVDARDPANAKICTLIDPAIYALDVAIPVLDLREESLCEPGDGIQTQGEAVMPFIGAIRVNEIAFWRWAKALYAILGAIVIGVAILTYSGVFKPKADA